MKNESITDNIFNIVHSYKSAVRSSLQANESGLNGMLVSCLTQIRKTENCTANDIVSRFGRDKAQIARAVKEMIAKGWIIKEPNPNDKRSQLLILTDSGLEITGKIIEAQKQIHEKMCMNLSEEELKEFKRITSIISSNLK